MAKKPRRNPELDAKPTLSQVATIRRLRTVARMTLALDPASPTFELDLAEAKKCADLALSLTKLPVGSPILAISRQKGLQTVKEKAARFNRGVWPYVLEVRAAHPEIARSGIARMLNNMGIRNSKGGEWAKETVEHLERWISENGAEG